MRDINTYFYYKIRLKRNVWGVLIIFYFLFCEAVARGLSLRPTAILSKKSER